MHCWLQRKRRLSREICDWHTAAKSIVLSNEHYTSFRWDHGYWPRQVSDNSNVCDYLHSLLDFTCQNDIPRCAYKAKRGYCKSRPDYYLKVCQKACGSCTEGVYVLLDKVSRLNDWYRKKYHLQFLQSFSGKPCQDEHRSCGEWATNQYCRSNAEYMLIHCKVSCKVCRKGRMNAWCCRRYYSKAGCQGTDFMLW